jgi:hypothetical protein
MTELTVSSRNLSVDDAPKIAAAISQLEKIGLKPLFPEREFPALARRMAEEFEGTGIPEPPLPLTWVDLALSGSKQVFAEPADGSTNSGAGGLATFSPRTHYARIPELREDGQVSGGK